MTHQSTVDTRAVCPIGHTWRPLTGSAPIGANCVTPIPFPGPGSDSPLKGGEIGEPVDRDRESVGNQSGSSQKVNRYMHMKREPVGISQRVFKRPIPRKRESVGRRMGSKSSPQRARRNRPERWST